MRCYCSICRKTGGGGGYAINLMGVASTLRVEGLGRVGHFRVATDPDTPACERHFCTSCGSALWVSDRRWPEHVHPFASAIDSPLPVPPSRTHIMLDFKADWVTPDIRPQDKSFPRYPDQSIEDWHRTHSLWID